MQQCTLTMRKSALWSVGAWHSMRAADMLAAHMRAHPLRVRPWLAI